MCEISFQLKGASERQLADLARRLDVPMEELAKAATTAFAGVVEQLENDRERRLRDQIDQASLGNDRLRGLAEQHQPPREWFDSEDDPFHPG